MDAVKEFLIDIIISTILSFDGMVTKAQEILTNETGAWSAALTFSNALKPFCYIIIAICLLIELAQVAAKVDIIKWEHGLKMCVKMVFAKLCIDIAPTFLRACYNQANMWIVSAASVGSSWTLSATLGSQVQDKLADVTGFFEIIGIFVPIMLVSLIIKIVVILVQVIAYGRMFEIYVYLAVSPVPCAFFPLGDGSGGGISRITTKFFKSFIAVCLQGVMIIICLRLFNVIVGANIQRLLGTALAGDGGFAVTELLYTLLLAGIVMFMGVAKCGSWAKGIIDAM